MTWLAIVLALTPCTPPAPDAEVKVSFPAGATLDDLEAFAARTLCRPKGQGGPRPLTLTLEGTVFGRQIPALVRLLAESAGGGEADAKQTNGVSPESPCPPVPAGTIVPVDPWTRKIKASAREPLLSCAGGQVRFVPSFLKGEAEGFKLFGIRAGSLVEQLGLQNGDVVTAINGQPMKTAEQALAAVEQAKQAPDVKLTLRRAGEPRTITWLLR